MYTKDIIAALFRRSVPYLKKLKDTNLKWQHHDEWKLDLLTLHKVNPAKYEEKLKNLESRIKEKMYEIDVLNEIIRRK